MIVIEILAGIYELDLNGRRPPESMYGTVKMWGTCSGRASRWPSARSSGSSVRLYKTECTREGSPFRTGPLETPADLEEITSAWVCWYNTSRPMHRLGLRLPAEADYHQQHAEPHPGQAHK
jgi:hypothetical protein